jgi:uncharacterized protein YceK
MKKFLLVAFIGFLGIGSTGCSSIDARTGGTQSGLYPGVKQSKENYDTHGSAGAEGFLVLPYVILDLPSCFVVDTVLLPVDLLKGLDFPWSEGGKVAPKP